jgi:cytochrome P450
MVVGYREARAALTDPRLSNDASKLPGGAPPDGPLSAVGLGRHLLAADPPDHTRMRRLLGAAFTPGRVEALRPRVTAIAADLVDAMRAHDEADLLDAFAVPLAVTVICELLGVPVDGRDTFRAWVKEMTAPAGDPEVVRRAAGALGGYLFQLVAGKQSAPAEDLLTALAKAHDEDQLDLGELMSNAFLMLVAGHETTVNLIGNGTVALLRRPGRWAALGADLDRVPAAIEEFLRYDGPVEHAGVRWALEDLELGGQAIPAGGRVFVILDAASRDPARYPEPDALDLARDATGHLAFGHGVHHCLGAPLARLEGAIAFRALLTAFPQLTLAVPAEDLRVRPSLLLRSFTAVPVRLRS